MLPATSAALTMDAPALAQDGDVSRARRLIAAYAPLDPHQAEFQKRLLAFIDQHPADAHLRTSLSGHLTASALIVDAAAFQGQYRAVVGDELGSFASAVSPTNWSGMGSGRDWSTPARPRR